MSTLPTDKAEDTAIDAEVMAKAKFCVIGILADMAKAEVEGRPLLNDDSPDKWGQIIARTLRTSIAKAKHFESHFQKLARDHGPANAALDTARREWAKRGEAR